MNTLVLQKKIQIDKGTSIFFWILLSWKKSSYTWPSYFTFWNLNFSSGNEQNTRLLGLLQGLTSITLVGGVYEAEEDND
jgi:hypothetical protein